MTDPFAGTAWDVSGSFLEWGVKQSLREYVRGVGAGAVDWLVPASDSRFPCVMLGPTEEPGGIEVALGGGVRFRAHGSLMDVALTGLTIRLTGQALSLSIAEAGGGRMMLFAEQSDVSIRSSDAHWEILAERPALTTRGASLLGGVYASGTVLDPIRLVLAHAREDALADVSTASE